MPSENVKIKSRILLCLWAFTASGAALAENTSDLEAIAAKAVKASQYFETHTIATTLPKLTDATDGGKAVKTVCDVTSLEPFPNLSLKEYTAIEDWAASIFKTLIVYGAKELQQGEDSPSSSDYANEFGQCIDASLIIGANLANSAARFLAADPDWGNNKADGFTFENIQNMNFGTISSILEMAHTNAPQPSWTKERLEVMETVLPYALPVISERQCNVLYWRAKSTSPSGLRAERGEENISGLFKCATWDIK